MAIEGFPEVSDDSGTYRDGTEIGAAVFAAIETAIEALCIDPSNPTITPADLMQEIVDARGSKDSIDERLDVAHNEDGTLKAVAGTATTSQLRTLAQQNLWRDSGMLLWPSGDAAAPWDTILDGTGAAIARCGSGLGDTTTLSAGQWCAKLTYGSTALTLTREILSSARIALRADLGGTKVCFAARGKCSVQNMLRLVVDDGVATTYGGASGNNSWHTGDGSDELLYVEHEISPSATKIEVYFEVAQSGSAYVGAPVVTFSDVAADKYIEDRWGEYTVRTQLRGTFTVSDGKNSAIYRMPYAGLFMGMAGACVTAPVGADATFDLDKDSDPAFGTAVSPYSTLPAIPDGTTEITAGVRTAPDGTYANRCFLPGDYFQFNQDAIGSGTAGADLTVDFMWRVPLDPFWALGA